ncbi:MAG: hypothetical protein U0835_00060 [Isosphaeraceae bacterium]
MPENAVLQRLSDVEQKNRANADDIAALQRVAAQHETRISRTEQGNQTNTERMIRVDEKLEQVMRQAQVTSETQSKAMIDLRVEINNGQNALKAEINDRAMATQQFVSDTCRDIQKAVDMLIRSLGIDQAPDAPYTLLDDLKFLKQARIARAETIKNVWNIVIKSTVLGVIALLAAGLGSYIYSLARGHP